MSDKERIEKSLAAMMARKRSVMHAGWAISVTTPIARMKAQPRIQ